MKKKKQKESWPGSYAQNTKKKKNRFSVGSKVKLKKSTSYRPEGCEGTGIVQSVDQDVCHVKFPACKYTISFYDYELESATSPDSWLSASI